MRFVMVRTTIVIVELIKNRVVCVTLKMLVICNHVANHLFAVVRDLKCVTAWMKSVQNSG